MDLSETVDHFARNNDKSFALGMTILSSKSVVTFIEYELPGLRAQGQVQHRVAGRDPEPPADRILSIAERR